MNATHLSDLVGRANLRDTATVLSKTPPAKAKAIIMWLRNPAVAVITDEQATFLIIFLGLENA